jgi:2-oxoglutarate dehydrogenase E2 component (dihydrolipoamide succinyltransferase)
MPIELKIPPVGESITEVQIGEWLKSEGEAVKQDEPVAVIDSEKTTFELPAPQSGRLTKILHQTGETVTVGTVVAHLEPVDGAASSGGDEASAPSEVAKTKSKQVEAPANKAAENPPGAAQETKPETASESKEAPASAAAKETPTEILPDTTSAPQKPVTSSPPVGEAAGRDEEVVPMTMLRRTAARRLVEAQQTMAMLTTFNEADMSSVQALRNEYQEAFEKRYQVKLGLMSFFIKAAVDALKQFPQLNAEVRNQDIVYRNYFDIGVAVGTERGLVVPVLRDAGRRNFADLERAVSDFGRRAKEGHLKPNELDGGTFTITNGGVFGSLLSTPIINPPQTGILGLHAIQDRPIAVKGQVVVRPMMYLALTYDHRIVDGREAVLFLKRVKLAIETPARLLIEV